MASLAREVPALQHVRHDEVLVVAGQARGVAHASIRSLVSTTHPVEVRIDGHRRYYEITLRPLWFRTSTLERRLEAVVHELWHIDPCCRGALHPDRIHRPGHTAAHRREIHKLTRAALSALDVLELAPLGHDGEVLIPAWQTRPVLVGTPPKRKRFSSKDIYLQPIRMITPEAARTVWW